MALHFSACADPELWGSGFEALDVRLAEGNKVLSFPELRETMTGAGDAVRVRINGIPYYARPIAQDYAFMLALLPESEIKGVIAGEVGTLMLLLALVSGVCVAFVLFHLRDPEEIKPGRNGRFGWREALAAKLKVAGVLAMAFVLVAGLYLGSLSTYAETFRYTRGKSDGLVRLFENNVEAYNTLENWFSYSLHLKSESAASILQCTEPEKQTREFLTGLAEQLDVQYIGRYDREGTLTVTNAPYFRETLKEDSPFRRLLEGTPAFTAPQESNPINGENTQQAGTALQNAEGLPDGMVILASMTRDIDAIQQYLDSGNAISQLSLTDKTAVLAISEQDSKILYAGEMRGGNLREGLNSSDVIGDTIQELGVPEIALRDHFNGNLHVMGTRYFASVRKLDDFWMLVMLPQTGIGSRYLIPVGVAVVVTLLFATLLILCACRARKEWIGTETGIPAVEQETVNPELPVREDADQKEKQDEVLAMLGSFIYREKPYFEERWPEDCTPWRKRSTNSRFMTVLRCILIALLGAILIHSVTAGENSVWYYCFNGEWERGINLYSLTSCLITLGLLLVGKIVIHKLLYLIARAANARGETICHLLDSFSDYFLWIAGIFICLANFGVNTTTLSLTGGVAGVVFGIGCQNVVADILAGILMTLEGVARVGDFVSFNGNYAVVLSVGVRTTRLKWYGTITPVRNNEFKNFVYLPSEKETRVLTPLTIDMNEPLDRIEKILEEELPQIHQRMSESVNGQVTGPIYRGIKSFTENGYVISLSFFCKGKYFGWLNRELNRELKSMCDRRGIRLALPQVVVHGAAPLPEEKKTEQ